MPTQNASGSLVTDEELIRQLRQGDAQAAEAIAERYRSTMVQFCFAYLGQLDDAEDAAQDVLAAVVSGRRLPDGTFRPWLYRVARNHCLDRLKRRKDGRVGAGSVVRDSRWASPRTGPRTAALRNERHERVRQLVAAMPEHHREVLVLRYFAGLGREEVASVLDLPDSTVRSRLYEASQKLREQLDDTDRCR